MALAPLKSFMTCAESSVIFAESFTAFVESFVVVVFIDRDFFFFCLITDDRIKITASIINNDNMVLRHDPPSTAVCLFLYLRRSS